MNPHSVVTISDVSIKNNVAISILHIHYNSNDIKKTIHYTVNITSTKTELFAIQYKIDQAVQIPKVSHIIIITDAIYLAKCIFDFTYHLYQ